MKTITRFADIRMSLIGKIVTLAVTALIALSCLNLALLPRAAFAEERELAVDQLVLPAPDKPDTGANVFVYLQLKDEALETAQAAGLNVNRDGWFTVGVIALENIKDPAEASWGESVAIEDVQDQIAQALKTIDFYPGAEALSLSAATWTSLRVNNGATDYDVTGNAWHLDGTLSEQLVAFDVRYVDTEGRALNVGDEGVEGEKTGTRTILAALGSTVEAADQAIEIEGYEYSEALTAEENGGLSIEVARADAACSSASGMTLVYEKKAEPARPENPGEGGDDPADKPGVPGNGGSGNGSGSENTNPGFSHNPTVDVPNIDFTLPQTPQGPGQDGAAAPAGFTANERATVSNPASQKLATTNAATAEPMPATPEDEAAVEEIAIDDDVAPMVARAGGSEAIAEEEVPMGAFDAPVDPAPWVAGLGAIGTALWGVVAVRRRLMMAQQLAAFEHGVLGNTVIDADAVVVPSVGHQVF